MVSDQKVIHVAILLLLLFLPPPPQCPPRTIRRLLDKNLTFHKAIAWMLVVSSAVHVIAHWYNYERLVGLVNLTTLRTRWPWEFRFVPELAQPSLPFISVSVQSS